MPLSILKSKHCQIDFLFGAFRFLFMFSWIIMLLWSDMWMSTLGSVHLIPESGIFSSWDWVRGKNGMEWSYCGSHYFPSTSGSRYHVITALLKGLRFKVWPRICVSSSICWIRVRLLFVWGWVWVIVEVKNERKWFAKMKTPEKMGLQDTKLKENVQSQCAAW